MARGGRRGRSEAVLGPIEDSFQSPLPPSLESPSATISPPVLEQHTNDTVPDSERAQLRVLPTYASLVDPDEGTTLEFIQAHEINGMKCAHLAEEDIEDEINY